VSFVLFLHVVGMLGLFVALGLDGVSVFRLRRAAAVDELAPWVGLATSVSRAYRGSIALVVLSGAYLTRELVRGMMAGARASELGWLTLSVVALVMFGIVGALSLRRMRPIWRALSSAPPPAHVQLTRAHDPLLPVLFILRTLLALTIVFLMMIRPSLDASILVMAGAGLLAVVAGGLTWRRPPLAEAVS
jgi:hypothetical protein